MGQIGGAAARAWQLWSGVLRSLDSIHLPTELNFRANVWGMKRLGAEWIVSVSAVGSLREEIVPGHVVVPDQFIDRTRQRASTFFGRGVVAHVQFADPLCPNLGRVLGEAAR